MYKQQLLWLGFLAMLGTATMTTSVKAETNQSDTSGGQTYSAPAVSIDSINGNGVSDIINFNSNTGTFSGGVLQTPIKFSGNQGSLDSNQTQDITINDAAELLGGELDQSLENLTAAEKADAAPRRIGRANDKDRVSKTCVNPKIQAQSKVETQLSESKKFIEQVDRIELNRNIW
jgi:hypothetical protein